MAAPATYAGIAISNRPHLSFVIGNEFFNAGAHGSVQLIGTTITWFLSGSLLVQCYNFFYTNHLDGDLKFIKVAVWVCLAVDQMRSMAVTSGAWQSLIVAWGNPTNFIGTSVFPVLTVPLTGIESCIVQIFFAWRIWTLKKEFKIYRIISSIICLVAFMQLAAAIARGVACAQSERVSSRQHNLDLSAELWLCGTLICDSIIVATMTFLLVQAKVESSFKSTKHIIDRLIIVTLETAAVTLITTLVQLIFYSRSLPTSNSLDQVGIMYILGGLYSNVLLTVLNSRNSYRRRLVEPNQTFSLNFAQQSTTAPLSSTPEEAPSTEVASKTQKDEESHVKSESSAQRC
ncbi:hypothetical protein K443DRAFT_135351 [Laccaria amethystina LaAM-08-1]|uniref:DUF6534 domain-containing protein n=1 Tax=Laccaria amethystina LaAM-08-1 TaxID=1095629 RepID=A0A0C9WNP7_9AGAR|nr:hypothetical protein K443DRAFT_135351 [Laccaria amethystina LaAM-08-1]